MIVIFDCDGVLVDSERLISRVQAELLTHWGWPMQAEAVGAEFKGSTFPQMAERIEERLAGRLPREWMYTWAMETASAFCCELVEIPGVRDLLERLTGTGVSVAVASQSALPRVRLSLQVTDLARYFGDRVFTASMVAHPKPAPDLFLLAARALGTASEHCTVIEDSPSGARAAVAARMRVLGYAADESSQALRDAGAEPFQTMSEVAALLGC